MNIYLASSWRNPDYERVLDALSSDGHDVYDFRNPNSAFTWGQVMPSHANNDPVMAQTLVDALKHPLAVKGYQQDYDALSGADAVILALPCGKSAHLELGHAAGEGKPTAVLLEPMNTPELMYSMATRICTTLDELVAWAGNVHNTFATRRELWMKIERIEREYLR